MQIANRKSQIKTAPSLTLPRLTGRGNQKDNGANLKSEISNLLLVLPPVGLHHYLALAALLFVCGLLTMALKRNAIGILMGVELVLNAANINLIAFNHFAPTPPLSGQIFAVFVIVLAAAEAAVAMAIFLNYYNNFATIDVEKATNLKG